MNAEAMGLVTVFLTVVTIGVLLNGPTNRRYIEWLVGTISSTEYPTRMVLGKPPADPKSPLFRGRQWKVAPYMGEFEISGKHYASGPIPGAVWSSATISAPVSVTPGNITVTFNDSGIFKIESQ